MPNPTVPKRANQIPRSLPAGVGGSNGFGHHPKPVSVGELDPRPSDFPMNQRRYRGAAGGQMQWDSRTETPVWREIPAGKTQDARRQYSPSPREQYPLTHKKSRYKPGLMRTPTRPGDKTLEPRTPIPINKQSLPKTPNPAGEILRDAIEYQFRVDPTGIGDSRIMKPFPETPPWEPPSGPAGELGSAACERGLSDEAVAKLYGKFGVSKSERGFISVEIYEIRDELGNFICTERFECFKGKCPGGKFMTGIPYWRLTAPAYTYMKYTSTRSSQQIGDVMGYGDLGGQGYISSLQALAQVYKVSYVNNQFIPSIGRMWQSNRSSFIIGIRTNSPEFPPTGQKNDLSLTGHGGSYGSGLRFGDIVDPKDNKEVNAAVDQNWRERRLEGYTRSIGPIWKCSLSPSEEQLDLDPIEPDDDYDFDVDEDTEMGCKWQKDEVSYELPKLKIGDTEVGGNSISIDDGLIPFADYMCKSIEIMFKGLGLDTLSRELPKNILKMGSMDEKFTPKSLGEVLHWQFNNVSGLVGAPVETAIKNIDGEEKTIPFRSVQDVISTLFHQQKESDLDLWVIENYCVRMAQQLEAVTQICLKQDADIDMLVKEAGFRWEWETRQRKTLYKHGMKEEDEKTGVVELFKGGEVAYPVRVWKDSLDQRQISMATNLYAEVAAKQGTFKLSASDELPGYDTRKKMNKVDEESWKEYVKTINSPSQSIGPGESTPVVSGSNIPFIEEYARGTLSAKKVDEPKSGLSLFQKTAKGRKG